jgi:hypothetical protein
VKNCIDHEKCIDQKRRLPFRNSFRWVFEELRAETYLGYISHRVRHGKRTFLKWMLRGRTSVSPDSPYTWHPKCQLLLTYKVSHPHPLEASKGLAGDYFEMTQISAPTTNGIWNTVPPTWKTIVEVTMAIILSLPVLLILSWGWSCAVAFQPRMVSKPAIQTKEF